MGSVGGLIVTWEEDLEKFIEKKRLDQAPTLKLFGNQLMSLPESIGNLPDLIELDLHGNYLTSLPKSIGNLSSLTKLNLSNNQLISLPETIGNLSNLVELDLHGNKLDNIPESIGNLSSLTKLNLSNNQLMSLPKSIGNLSSLVELDMFANKFTHLPSCIENLFALIELEITSNQLASLPKWIGNMSNLTYLILNGNLIDDLSFLQPLTGLYDDSIEFLDVYLPRKYWIKFSDWKPEWLLEEQPVEIKRMLIQQVGYEKICQRLNAIEIDRCQEYTLLKIADIERVYDEDTNEEVLESMVLLKRTCPSTGHIHILRVPSEMTSAEAAITWVNNGIHPDEFTVQT